MKVAVIIGGYFKDKMGGAEYQAYLLSMGLAKRNNELILIAIDSSVNDEFIENEVLIIRLKSNSKNNYQRLGKILKNVDIVYLREYDEIPKIFSLCKELNIPLALGISSIMDCRPLIFHHRFFPEIKHIKSFLKISNIDFIVCQTQNQKKILHRYFNKQYFIIPNGHPIPEEIYYKVSPPVLLWVNNLKRIKRPELFIELAEKCRSTLPDVKFIMIGRPIAKGFFKRKIDKQFSKQLDNLYYLGEKSLEETNEYIGHSTFLINTSTLVEGFPNSFIQAWLRGVPSATLGVDPDGIIEANKLGFCCRSIAELSEKVICILKDEKALHEMNSRCIEFAKSHFNVDLMISNYEKAFSKISQAHLVKYQKIRDTYLQS